MVKDLLRERLAKYIPPKDQWTPVDEALYGVDDIYNVPEEEAKKLRTNAIRYAFGHHYENNRFYHEYCKDKNVTPDDIKTEEDFVKIPLIPDTMFKSYPEIERDGGKEFLKWLEKFYPGMLPKELELVNLNEKLLNDRIYLTRGRSKSIVLRDQTTYNRLQYSGMSGFKLYPLDIGKKDCVLTDFPRGNDRITKIWEPILDDSTAFRENEKPRKQFSRYTKLMKRMNGKNVVLLSEPYFLDMFMEWMEKKRVKFYFNGCVAFYGGWINDQGEKIYENGLKRMILENLGIPENNCRDWFIMNELNAGAVECEAGYKHLPYFIYPIVFDEDMAVLPSGEWGRFAFLDPLANSYPGFILSNNRAKTLESCPGCPRESMVLDSEISPMRKEIKGCAAVLGKAIERGGR